MNGPFRQAVRGSDTPTGAPPIPVGGRHADDNGFMVKWAEAIGPDDCPMMIRWVVQTPLGSVRVHHFLRDDRERDPHDHPWWFLTLMLRGSYQDRTPCWKCKGEGGWAMDVWPPSPDVPSFVACEVCHGMRYLVDNLRAGSIRFRPALHRHWVMTENAWTLIVTGRKTRHWGFWKRDVFVPVRDYFTKVGYAPCQ